MNLLPPDKPHPASLDAESLLTDCEIRRQRRSGPGGQHRNKVETAVVIKHLPTGIEGQASERRSQGDNRKVAIGRLRMNLAIEARKPLEAQESPSALWSSRCQNGRINVSRQHSDFPAILAEALDVLFDCDVDLSAAAKRLSCTASQLARLIKTEPPAWSLLNKERSRRGLRPLK